LQIFLEPIGLIRNSLAPGYIEIEKGSTVETLIKSLNLPFKLNVIAIVEGKRVSMDEPVRDGSSIKIVSLTLGG
jgi:sulfur carrier protein ThiS